MTDLEITRLCAEAMEFVPPQTTIGGVPWNPLVFDAQAMALVKKMRLDIEAPLEKAPYKKWSASYGVQHRIVGPDLNRAICECVAKMELARRQK